MQPTSALAGTTLHPRLRRTRRQLAWICCTLAAPWAHAQLSGDGSGGGLTIVPTFSAQETLTSNRDLTSNGQADSITQVSAGIRMNSRSGRLQGSLAYTANALFYARSSGSSTLQNALDAALRAELLENHLFVDGSANVSQQSISAFGTQGRDAASRNANSTEVATLNLSPTLRGNLGGYADVSLGAHIAASRSDGSSLGDSNSHSLFAAANGGSGFIGWGVNASRQTSSFKGGRTTQTDQLGGSLTYVARYDLRFTARVGASRSDVLSGSEQGKPTSGFGVNWQPTDRTTVALDADKTYYGKSHSYNVVHRAARSVWSYLDSAGVSGLPDGRQQVRPLTKYDLYFAICTLAGGDAATCDRLVLAQLAAEQSDRNTVVTLGFLNASLTVQRTQLLSVSYAALRTTFTLSAARSETSALGQTPTAGDLAQGGSIRQQTATLGVSHQLLPDVSLNATGSQQTTSGTGALNGNRLRTASLGVSTAPGPRTTLSINARHSRFYGDGGDYKESAVFGALGLRF